MIFKRGVFFDLRLRNDRAWISFRRGTRQGFAAAEAGAHLIHRAAIVVVLRRKILAPHSGIFGIVRKLDHPIERIARLLLALEDIDKQRNDASGYESPDADKQKELRPIKRPFWRIALRAHELKTVLSFY
jgi:hypothetical protein